MSIAKAELEDLGECLGNAHDLFLLTERDTIKSLGSQAKEETGELRILVHRRQKELQAKALADELGPNARAASVENAITGGDAVVLALWLDNMREVIPQHAHLLDGKVVVDPSNPIGFDANGQIIRTLPDHQSAGSIVSALLPAGAHYVKAFGTLAAEALAGSANREPRRAALFYATDDDTAAATARTAETTRAPARRFV
jgi:predicted dinucleotide-binding enzyme